MTSLRWFAGAVVLILSTAGTVCCAAGVIAVWVFGPSASRRAQDALARLDVGLERVSAAGQNVRRALATARADLAEVGKESNGLGRGGQKGRLASRTVRTLIQQKVGPDVEDLNGRLATLSDAALAASSLLQSVQELAPGQLGRLDPGDVERWGEQTRQLSASLRRLQAVVGDGGKEAGARQVAAATGDVDRALQTCQELVDDWQSRLDAAREQTRRVQAKTPGWLMLTGIGLTVLCVWAGLGQVSLFAHARRWLLSPGPS